MTFSILTAALVFSTLTPVLVFAFFTKQKIAPRLANAAGPKPMLAKNTDPRGASADIK